MTVKELIEKLQTLPQDLQVIYRCRSEYSEMDAEQVIVVDAKDKKIIHRVRSGYMDYNPAYFERTTKDDWGRIVKIKSREQPKFVTVVVFPGN